MSRLPNQWLNKPNRRRFLQGSAAAGAGFLAASLPGRVLGQDTVTVVNSIRSLSNPYHASWNQGGEAFANWAGADYATLVTEGNSEKGIADIKAMIAKTGGNMVLNVDPNESPDARPIVEACAEAGVYVTTQWNKPADLHPWDFDPHYVAHISFDGKPNGKDRDRNRAHKLQQEPSRWERRDLRHDPRRTPDDQSKND